MKNCKYRGHCINDKLIDDDDMAIQSKQIYAQGRALVRKFYTCRPTKTVRMSLINVFQNNYLSLVSLLEGEH